MRLSKSQKEAVLEARPGSRMIRARDQWAVIWHDLAQPRAERWRAQLVKAVTQNLDGRTQSWDIWWAGNELGARTRAEVCHLLNTEAAR